MTSALEASVRPAAPRACVVVPTRDEAANVAPLLARLGAAVSGLDCEVLFVDDSDDDTPAAVRASAAAAPLPVRLLHRPAGERVGGLGGAVQAALRHTDAEWVVVMDGDLQHPPELVRRLLAVAADGADVVVASRYCGSGSSAAGLASRFRGLVSGGATAAARLAFPRSLRRVTDPMSGFFAVRREAVSVAALRPRGFKILLELLVRHPHLRAAEVPFTFGARAHGSSKAGWREGVRFARQLAALRLATCGRVGRLVRFAVVGGSGVAVNLLVLAGLLGAGLGTELPGGEAVAAVVATQAAIAWNFALTERWVFRRGRDRRGRRAVPFWLLNCAALLAQLPLATGLQPVLGGSYLLATGAALGALALARFQLCDRWLYRPARRPRLTVLP